MDASLSVVEDVRCEDVALDKTLRTALPDFRAPTFIDVTVARLGDGAVIVARMRSEGYVVERAFRAPNRKCDGLVRAVSAWASIVSDGWTDKSAEATGDEKTAGPPALPSKRALLPKKADVATPEIDEEGASVSRRDRPFRGELGIAGHVSDGLGSGAYAGVGVAISFVFDEQWVLREEVVMSSSALQLGTERSARWAALATELCHRARGNYQRGSGVSVEACVHAEPGMVELGDPREARSFTFLSMGPVAAIRGDVGDVVSFEVRAVGLWHAAKPERIGLLGSQSAPTYGARGEIAVSARAF